MEAARRTKSAAPIKKRASSTETGEVYRQGYSRRKKSMDKKNETNKQNVKGFFLFLKCEQEGILIVSSILTM